MWSNSFFSGRRIFFLQFLFSMENKSTLLESVRERRNWAICHNLLSNLFIKQKTPFNSSIEKKINSLWTEINLYYLFIFLIQLKRLGHLKINKTNVIRPTHCSLAKRKDECDNFGTYSKWYVITLGHRASDNISRMITISGLLLIQVTLDMLNLRKIDHIKRMTKISVITLSSFNCTIFKMIFWTVQDKKCLFSINIRVR